jgi:hypothetical protein
MPCGRGRRLNGAPSDAAARRHHEAVDAVVAGMLFLGLGLAGLWGARRMGQREKEGMSGNLIGLMISVMPLPAARVAMYALGAALCVLGIVAFVDAGT